MKDLEKNNLFAGYLKRYLSVKLEIFSADLGCITQTHLCNILHCYIPYKHLL